MAMVQPALKGFGAQLQPWTSRDSGNANGIEALLSGAAFQSLTQPRLLIGDVPLHRPEGWGLFSIFFVTGTETGRLAPLLRWLGLTLVAILVLQMAAVLVGVDWTADARRPQVTGPLVALAPLGFAGLLICLIGSRLDHPEQSRSPLRLVIAVLSALLALGMVAAVPLSLDGGAGDVARLRNLEQGREALKDARAFRADEEQVTSLGEQLAQAGQLAADASDEDKLRAAEKMVDDQIAQMEAQLKTVEAGQARESQQRFIGGTITAVVLAIAFVLLAFTAVL